MAVFPAASDTTTTTVVAPTSKKEPDIGFIDMTLAEPELSEIEDVPTKSTNAPEDPSTTVTVTSSWQMTVGGMESTRGKK